MQIKMNLQEIAYFCFFGILLFAKGIGLYEGMPLFNICLALAVLCIACKILLTDYTVKEWGILILFTLISFVAYRTTGEKAVLITAFTILGMKNIPVKRLLRFAFVIWTMTFYGMMLFHIFDTTDASILAHNKFGLGFLLRYSMGFPHPNVFHISFFIWMALLLYLFPMTKQRLVVASILLFGMNCFIFLYSVSITGFALVTLYLLFNLYLNGRKKLNIVEKVLIQCVYPACVLVSILPPLLFKGRLYDLFNKLLNTRMNIWNYYLTNFTPKLFGTRVWSPEDAVLSMDCSYLYLLYYYGIVLFVCISALFVYTIWRYTRENKKAELAIIIGMLIAGITEPYLFNLSFKNLILIFAGSLLFVVLSEVGAEMNCQNQDINRKQSRMVMVLNRRVQILPWGQKELQLFAVDTDKWKQRKEAYLIRLRKSRKWFVIIGMLAAALGLFIGIAIVKVPQKIYVYTEHCDYVKGDGVSLQEVQQEEGAVLYGVRSKELNYYGFDGNMLLLEKIRGILSVTLGIVLLSEFFFCVILWYSKHSMRKLRRIDQGNEGSEEFRRH